MVPTASELRDPRIVRSLLDQIHEAASGAPAPMRLMEVCGGQTHTLYRYRLRELLPSTVRMVSGPGCPVCVTPTGYVDQAIDLASRPGVEVFTFGDLVRVPGSRDSLEKAKARGATVREVYAPSTALEHARSHPEVQVVFLGIGFETTLPAFSLALRRAIDEGIGNFSVLLSAKRVPPLLRALLEADAPVEGFVTPGHVTTVLGVAAYQELVERFLVPMVVGGFEPVELLTAIRDLVRLVVSGGVENRNAYPQACRQEGNPRALRLIEDLYEPRDEEIRGVGVVPEGGWTLREEFAAFDAARRFGLEPVASREPGGCRCGDVLVGRIEPAACPLFGKACLPERPVGACMVSGEGTCNAAWRYRGVATWTN